MVSLHTHRPDAAKIAGEKNPATGRNCSSETAGFERHVGKRLAGAPGRAVLSVYPCHPENHLPKITDGDRDKAVPVFLYKLVRHDLVDRNPIGAVIPWRKSPAFAEKGTHSMCIRFVYRGDDIITGFNFDI